MTIVDFLHARLDETEAMIERAKASFMQGVESSDEEAWLWLADQPGRELAAKRRMINETFGGPDHEDMWDFHMRLLALPYADHEDYDPAWTTA